METLTRNGLVSIRFVEIIQYATFCCLCLKNRRRLSTKVRLLGILTWKLHSDAISPSSQKPMQGYLTNRTERIKVGNI